MGGSGRADDELASTVEATPGDLPTRAGGPPVRGVRATLTADHGDVPDLGGWTGDERGRYALEDEIARGGGGRVVAARDLRLGREVAVKLPLDEPGSLQRLVREAQLMARLEHPSIVSVHDLTRAEDGTPFYVMKLLAGETLRARIAGRTFEERIAMLPTLIAIADAVAYAHHRGIVHRDLKPGNVIIGEFGETSVIDWGLARAVGAEAEGDEEILAGDASVTQSGAVVGTPAYMPPEQARGEVVSVRADVYGLGALCYHVLSGEVPYAGADTLEVIAKVVDGPPVSLTEREPRVPADLAAIVQKAMARRPADRYADAQELAADLRRYQAGRLVAAHRYSPWQRLRRWARRQWTRLVLGGAVVATAAAVAIAWPDRRPDAKAMCALADDRVDAVWTPVVHGMLAERVRASGGPGASTAAGAITDRLDGYARALGAARVEACAATHVRGEQSPELLDRRMGCLDRRLDDLQATIGLFDAVGPRDIEALMRATGAVPDLDACADIARLGDIRPLPIDPIARADVLAVRAALAAADATFRAGRFEAALAQSRAILGRPGASWDPTTSAAARLGIGIALEELGRNTEAEAELRTASRAAELAGADLLRADALLRLARIAETGKRPDEADRLLADHEALTTRLHDRERHLRRLVYQSMLLDARGAIARGIEVAREAVAAWERDGFDPLGLADLYANLGGRLINASRYAEAIEPLQRASEIYAKLLGSEHPNQAKLLGNLGAAKLALGDAAAAAPMYERALALLQKTGLSDTREGLVARGNYTSVLAMLGRHADAERELLSLLEVDIKVLGPDAPQVGTVLYNLGNNRLLTGDAAGAEPWFRKATEHALKYRGESHPRTAYMRWGLAAALLDLDRAAEAVPLLEAALPIQLAESGESSDDLAFTRLALARGYLALGQPPKALGPARACQAYFDAYQDPADRAMARFVLARALHLLGKEPARVRALAEQARADFTTAKKPKGLAQVEQLLAELTR